MLLYHGDDRFAMVEAQKKLERELLDPAWRVFNFAELSGDTPLATVLEAVTTVPFGGGNRFVVVDGPAVLKGKSDDPGLDAFERQLKIGLPARAYLLFKLEKLDSRLKTVKTWLPFMRVTAFQTPAPWQMEEQLAEWVVARAKGYQRRIAPAAVTALLRATGGDRWRIDTELQKLALYTDHDNAIGVNEVARLVHAQEPDVFALTDALAKQSVGAALIALSHLRTTHVPLRILASVITLMRQWTQMKSLAEAGHSPVAIAKTLNLRSDFRVRKDLDNLSKWRASALAAALEHLLRCDLALKTGDWPTDLHALMMEQCVIGLLVDHAKSMPAEQPGRLPSA